MSSLRLKIEDGKFRDRHGRQIVLRGINVAGDVKAPSQPDQPSHIAENFFDGDNVKFHGRPFPKEDADLHFSRLKRFGYNSIRYVFTWEAIEAAGPGIYDEEWIQHTIEILRLAKGYGFHIYMDPHQDVVSQPFFFLLTLAPSVPLPLLSVPSPTFVVVSILWWLRRPHVDSVCLRT